MTAPFLSLSFGPYVVYPTERVVCRDGRQVKVGSRAFDLLLALLSKPGEVIASAELIARVWPRTVVEDSSLRVQLGLLRKALGEGIEGARYIATLSGRGYSFVAPVSFERPASASASSAAATGLRDQRMAAGAPLVGREGELAEVVTQSACHPLVVLTGPGGVGKSVLAMAAAARLEPLFGEGFRVVDLSCAADCRHARAMVETAIAPPAQRSTPPAPGRHLLLVLDNCDAHVGCVQALVRSLQDERPGVHVLVTLREPSRMASHRPHGVRLQITPLPYPDPAGRWTPAEALSFPAVQLFVREAMDRRPSFRLDGTNVDLVVEACGKVRGGPLAIKLATAWTEHLALNTIVGVLDACVLQDLAVDRGCWHAAGASISRM